MEIDQHLPRRPKSARLANKLEMEQNQPHYRPTVAAKTCKQVLELLVLEDIAIEFVNPVSSSSYPDYDSKVTKPICMGPYQLAEQKLLSSPGLTILVAYRGHHEQAENPPIPDSKRYTFRF